MFSTRSGQAESIFAYRDRWPVRGHKNNLSLWCTRVYYEINTILSILCIHFTTISFSSSDIPNRCLRVSRAHRNIIVSRINEIRIVYEFFLYIPYYYIYYVRCLLCLLLLWSSSPSISRQNRANKKREYLRVPLSIRVYYTCVCVRGALCRRRSSSSGGGVSCSVRWPVRDSHIMIYYVYIGTATTTTDK